MGVKLYDHQKDALNKLKTGCILCGGTGSGKSITALAYYHTKYGGYLDPFKKMTDPVNLYIITTARKRDEGEWDNELIPFLLSKSNKVYDNIDIVVDSWNNIGKYTTVKNSFFIFDEQRVVGSGAWVKSFYAITKKNLNDWILLSATPGDTWMDYIPVFVANGFFKNKTEFKDNHVVIDYSRKYPVVDRYLNTGRLIRLRNSILVNMEFDRKTIQHHIDIPVSYDIYEYKWMQRNRYDKENDEPIANISKLCYELRKITNSSTDRLCKLIDILKERKRAVIFYNFDYELDLIKNALKDSIFEVSEWNGHKHQPIPEAKEWVYLVQYNSGAEAWNCTKTDTIIFYSQNYSYKIMIQAAGRIDRLNTPYIDLYYYHLISKSPIDIGIMRALKNKKKFNETNFFKQNEN